MDRKLNKRIADYGSTFKNDIKQTALSLRFDEKDKLESLIEFVFQYERLVLTKDDVSKRKRIKNAIPSINRCCAKRASGEQCTRKQKEGSTFCGTHVKGTPHGIINVEGDSSSISDIVVSEVFAEEIGGIVYYLDKLGNVFNTEDILNEKQNPRIIASYTTSNNSYSIPSFGL